MLFVTFDVCLLRLVGALNKSRIWLKSICIEKLRRVACGSCVYTRVFSSSCHTTRHSIFKSIYKNKLANVMLTRFGNKPNTPSTPSARLKLPATNALTAMPPWRADFSGGRFRTCIYIARVNHRQVCASLTPVVSCKRQVASCKLYVHMSKHCWLESLTKSWPAETWPTIKSINVAA